MNKDKFIISKVEKSNVIELTPKIGRNDLCYCGSGKKYKNCCLKKDQEKELRNNSREKYVEVSDNHFTVKEYLELSGHPVVKFDFFMIELLNIIGDTLHKDSNLSNDKRKKVLQGVYHYSKEFYNGCLSCKNRCLETPTKVISFKYLIDQGLEMGTLPPNLQKRTCMNFFYIEFINAIICQVEEELSKEIEAEAANSIAGDLFNTILDYVSDNCSEKCGNECISEHGKNAYCKFCSFGKTSLPCPKEGDISYEVIKATDTDMVH
jgi:hypothetical protein